MKNQLLLATQFFAISWLLLGLGCTTFKAQNCSENAGYEKGMNDAKMGRTMSLGQFAVFCNKDETEAAQKGYKSGYEAGKKSEGGSQLNVSFENGKLGLVGAYQCQITASNQTVSENASSEAEARNKVIDQCYKRKIYCNESQVSCFKK